MWVRALLAAVLFLTVSAAHASAGTYDVVACNAPGANGVNNSWRTVTEALPGVTIMADAFDFGTSCSPGLYVRSHSPEQRTANWTNTGAFRIDAPAGTSIVAVRATRYDEVRSSADDPNTATAENGDWDVLLSGDGFLVGGEFGQEQCHSEGPGICTKGERDVGSDTGLIRVAPTPFLRWGVSCGGAPYPQCFANAGPGFGNYSLGIFWLYGATVTIEDLTSPSAALGGDLLGAGWRKPSEALTWSASDNTGIRRRQLLVDGVEVARGDSSCDATKTIPCPNASAAPVSPGPIADGRHELRFVATDSAGNPTTVTKSVDVDGNGPTAVLSRASGKTITVSVSDGASGVAGGAISVRNTTAEPFRPLPTTLANGRLTAKLDRGSASRVGVSVNVTDNAGNVTAGEMSEMSLRVGGRTLRGGAASVSYRRSASFSGRIATRDGLPLAGQAVAVEETSRAAGSSPTVVGTVTTDAKGRFAYRAPAGPSRRVRFVFAGVSGFAPLTRTAQLRVRASSTIHASPRTLRGGGRVRFSGRLGLLGANVPRSGKLVDLQAFDGGRWRTFATARARGSRGAWSSTYRFAGNPGRYPVRLRIRREDVFPYDLGYSRSVVVRVR
jgi:hypothetical protein